MTDKNLTEIVAIIDRSGSMYNLVDDTIGGFNSFIEEQKKGPGKALLTLVQFDTNYEINYQAKDVNDVIPLDKTTYVPRGGTALFDAVARTVTEVGQRLSSIPDDKRPGTIIFLVITDGQENASHEFGGETGQRKVSEMVKHQIEKYSWDFVYMGGGDLQTQKAQGISLGIRANKVYNYSLSGDSTKNLYKSAGAAFTRRRVGASIGETYSADADMLNEIEISSLVEK